MRRGTLIFIVFVLVVGAVVGASQFLRSQPPQEFTVAVNPLAAEWVRSAVNDFNATNPVVNSTQRIQFSVTVIDDLPVWQGNENWTTENHPAVWIPAAAISVDYAERYVVQAASVAQTPLVWGGYASRVEVVTENGTQSLDWTAIQRAAEAESWSSIGGDSGWRFVKFAFARPDQAMSGVGALFSSAASFNATDTLTGTNTRAQGFRDWFTPVVESVPNFQTLGADPASAMAVRGPSNVEIALLPESQWLMNLNGLVSNEPVVFNYPAYQFLLDFPLARWNSTTLYPDIEPAAATALGQWLTNTARQAQLPQYGLRPASGEVPATARLFTAAEQYGIELQPVFDNQVQPPSRSETQGLLQWFTQAVR